MSLIGRQRIQGLLAGTAMVTLLLARVASAQQPEPVHVTMVQLIATPEKYDGKLVNVVGFLAFENEGDHLYLHKEDYDNGIYGDSVEVHRTKQMFLDREKLDGNYVIIVGVFRRRELPPIYVSTGRIEDIQRCTIYSRPSHPFVEYLKELQSPEPKQKQ